MRSLVEYASRRLSELADPARAPAMAAYMKTDDPFYGVQSAGRRAILREMVKAFPPGSRREYDEAVLALWERPHREEKYLAVAYARSFPEFVSLESIPLYRRLIVEGAWWDFVDEVAIRCVGMVWLHKRAALTVTMNRWVDDDDMWLRRTAIIGQIKHKDGTDAGVLFDFCSRRVHEKEFFIRKAIGWALREYAKTAPDAVADFAVRERGALSGLSFREATRHLDIA